MENKFYVEILIFTYEYKKPVYVSFLTYIRSKSIVYMLYHQERNQCYISTIIDCKCLVKNKKKSLKNIYICIIIIYFFKLLTFYLSLIYIL
jgi:hypothetical protein